MKSFLKKPIWLLGLVLIFSPITNYGQVSRSSLSELLREDANDRWMPFTNPQDMTPEQFFETYRSELGLTQDDEMRMTKTRNSMKDGLVQKTYQQYFKGIEVFGATMIAHIDNGKLTLLNGDIGQNLSLDINPQISLSKAMESAADLYGGMEDVIFSHEKKALGEPMVTKMKEPDYPIVIITKKKDVFSQEELYPAYKIDLKSKETHKNQYVYIDIHSGKLVKEVNANLSGCQTGTVHTMGNGVQNLTTNFVWNLFSNHFNLKTDCNGYDIHTYWLNNNPFAINPIMQFNRSNNTWGSTSAPDEPASAHWAAQETWDFFNNFNNFNHHGLDGNGLALDIVMITPDLEPSYSENDDRITIPLPFDREVTMPDLSNPPHTVVHDIDVETWAVLDVVAHEYTHGVILEGANLQQGPNESGALHEGFADIFGAMLERGNGASFNEIWQHGDKVASTNNHLLIRSLADPNQFNFHFDTSLGNVLGLPNTYGQKTFWDQNGDPHNNGSPIGHWFYLLVTGATHQNGTTVTGIGYDDAALIAFETMMTLPAAGNFFDARAIAINFAETEFGLCTPQHIGTIEAFNAVMINNSTNLPSQNITGSITGSTYSLCYNVTETYTATFVPGATYNWLVGPGLQIISSSGNTCTVEKTNGSGSIILCNVSTPCDNKNFIRQINSTGTYFPQAPALVSTTYNLCPGDYKQVDIMIPEPGMTYNWSMSPPNSGLIYPNGTTCIFTPFYNGTVTISATPSNSCGTGTPGTAQFNVNSNFPGCQGLQVASSKKAFNNSFSLAPNPAKDKVNITYTNASKVELVDINGKTILIEALNPQETQRKLSLSGLASGLYLVRLFDNQQTLIGIEKLLVR